MVAVGMAAMGRWRAHRGAHVLLFARCTQAWLRTQLPNASSNIQTISISAPEWFFVLDTDRVCRPRMQIFLFSQAYPFSTKYSRAETELRDTNFYQASEDR